MGLELLRATPDRGAPNALAAGTEAWAVGKGTKSATLTARVEPAMCVRQVRVKHRGVVFVEVLGAPTSKTAVADMEVIVPRTMVRSYASCASGTNVDGERVFKASGKQCAVVHVVVTHPFPEAETADMAVLELAVLDKEPSEADKPKRTLTPADPGFFFFNRKQRDGDTLIEEARKEQAPMPRTATIVDADAAQPAAKRAKISTPPEPKPATEDKAKPGVFSGMTFVISGIQNPERGKLRDAVLEHGGQYSGDWKASCTHLITAFMDTPKMDQAKKSGGTVVDKSFVHACVKAGAVTPDIKQKWVIWAPASAAKETASESETDEDEGPPVPARAPVPKAPFPGAFRGFVFAFLDNVAEADRRRLERIAYLYDGLVESDANAKAVTHVVSTTDASFPKVVRPSFLEGEHKRLSARAQ